MKIFTQAVAFMLLLSALSLVQAEDTRPVSLDEATKKIAQKDNNRILNAKTELIENKKVHIIKFLTPEGRIQQIKIDADTGKVLDNQK